MKNLTIQLKGVYSALFTIYDEQMNVKKNAVHKLMKYHQENGLRGFYVGGNSGEGMVLPVKTRMDMLEAVMEEKKDSTIISHIGAALHPWLAKILVIGSFSWSLWALTWAILWLRLPRWMTKSEKNMRISC